MKVRMFVSGSAVVLAVWLGATYFHEISARDYPTLGLPKKPDVPASASTVTKAPALVVAETPGNTPPVAATTE